MANYSATVRTNYFSVKDETAFRNLIEASRAAEDQLNLFEQNQEDGNMKFGFGCQSYILGAPDPSDNNSLNTEYLYECLQGLVPDDDAIIITEIGSEKLRYVTAFSTVITKDKIQTIDISTIALDLARKLLNNPDYYTKMDY